MKRTYVKYDAFEVRVGKGVVTSYGEVQITYTVEVGHPLSVKYRMHPTHPWQDDTFDFFSDIDEDDLLQHAMEEGGE